MFYKTQQRWINLNYVFFAIIIFSHGELVTPTFASDLGLSEADCRCCHGSTLADRHHLLVNTSGLECLTCHSLTLNPDTFLFDLSVTRDCLQCHTGSLADRHHLLVDQVTYDCFSCHAIVWDPETLQYVADFNNTCQYSDPPAPSGTISGNVADQLSTGLDWVKIATDNGAFSALTTATGNYELPNVDPGSYSLTASIFGFTGASQNIMVTDGVNLSIDFVLSPLNLSFAANGVTDNTNNLVSAAIASPVLTERFNIITDWFTVAQSESVTASQNQMMKKMPSQGSEFCSDGIDNNGNGLVDCKDQACLFNANCQASVSSFALATEICNDGIDNDKNTLTDCRDPACIGIGNCESPLAEKCNDTIDNNGDELIDCEDPLCNKSIFCLAEVCDDGIDNNSDGLIDCGDPECTETSSCRPPPVEICSDNIDNDNNSMIDCDDAKCADLDACVPPVADELCKNGRDDNNDGFIDCADVKCQFRAVCLSEICDNNIDDDADRRVDCEDRDCRDTPVCSTYSAGVSLNFSATASRESPLYQTAYTHDKDTNTRWWVQEDKWQWLKLDLGGIYPVDRVDINWHTLYATQYKIRVSENGNSWRTARVVNKSDGGYDSTTFNTRDARFILIEFKKPADTGYSIYEVEVFRGAD